MIGRNYLCSEVAPGVFKFLKTRQFSEDPDRNREKKKNDEQDQTDACNPETFNEFFLSFR
jgi:hypothetical protein